MPFAAVVSSGSTNLSTGNASAAPASPTPASKNAHAAVPAANRPRVTSTVDRCVRTVWSPTPTTSKSASTAVAVVRSASALRTGRSAARCPTLPTATCSICGEETPCGTSRITGRPWCPACQHRTARCCSCGRTAAVHLWHPHPAALRGLHHRRPSGRTAQPAATRPIHTPANAFDAESTSASTRSSVRRRHHFIQVCRRCGTTSLPQNTPSPPCAG